MVVDILFGEYIDTHILQQAYAALMQSVGSELH